MNNFRGEFKVTLDNKEHDGLLNLNALRLMTQANKIELDGIEDMIAADPLGGMCSLAYWGVKNAALRTGVASNLPNYDMFCAILLDDMEEFNRVALAVTAAMNPTEKEGNE